MNMDYKTYPPSELVSSCVQCFWTLKSDAPSTERQRIVPDGCMEMIFHCGDPYRQFLDPGDSILQPRSFVFGQITEHLEIAPTGISDIVAARFHPGGFAPFQAIGIKQMDNRAVPLTELFGVEGQQLEAQVFAARSDASRIEIIQTFLEQRLDSKEAIDALAKVSVELLLDSHGQLDIAQLANEMNTSPRQLERRFSTQIGLSPKHLSRIIRLQSALRMLDRKECENLTDLAYRCGYFDQAHFIKDFREFTGISPGKFYASNLVMSKLFIST